MRIGVCMRYDEIVNEGMKVLEKAKITKRWLNLGAETQSQNHLNREYIDSLTFEMRILGSKVANTKTTLFGVDLPAPIMIAPLMHGRVLNKLSRSDYWRECSSFSFSHDYMEEIAYGVNNAKSMMWLGIGLGRGGEDFLPNIIDKGINVVLMVKPLRDKKKVEQLFKMGEDLGCVAVGMDIDAMFGEKQFDEVPGPHYLGPQSIEDLKRYKEITSLPFILKGILSVQDAKIAQETIGADAIVVSTHGGESLDYTVPILKVLPEIRNAVGQEMSIITDSGFRRGTDVLKALALGADGVCFGALIILSFVAYGREGVTNMLNALYKELERAMTLTGCKSIDEIDPSIIRFP
jgi:hypothetical protein